jgi:hypothetical protein
MTTDRLARVLAEYHRHRDRGGAVETAEAERLSADGESGRM